MYTYLLAKENNTYTHTKIRFYKPKDRLVNIVIAKNDRKAKHFSPKTVQVLYKLISCKHLVN